MPTISYFYGIYIMMHVREHLPPHFHAEYQGMEAQVAIETGEIIKGKLPPQAKKLVEQWRKLHVQELQENWDNAMKLILPKSILPLELFLCTTILKRRHASEIIAFTYNLRTARRE